MATRVLQVLKTSGIGGAERHLLTLLPGLADRGVDVRVLVAATGEADRFVEALRATGVDVRTTAAGPDLNPFLYRRIRKEIAAFRPDLVHTHLIHADAHGQIAAARSRLPAVSSMHSAHDFYTRLPYRPVCRYVSREAARIIAISGYVKRFAEELRLNAPATIDVVPYGIDHGAWDADMPDEETARHEYGLKDEVAFGIASRLIPGKGHSALVRAFIAAAAYAPEARLLMAGDGPLRSKLEHEIPSAYRDRIRLVGFVGDVSSFMRACDVLVFPTSPELGEGFGLAALEAMACARPVIATRVGALPEVVEDGRTGLVVAPRDEVNLANAIARLARDAPERSTMGSQGRQRSEEQFSATRMVDGTLAVYGAVTGQKT